MRSTRHYLVAGVLSAELELTLRPSFLVDSPPLDVPEVSVAMPSVRAQLLDARGEPLAWAEPWTRHGDWPGPAVRGRCNSRRPVELNQGSLLP
jgi:hypothetical protein